MPTSNKVHIAINVMRARLTVVGFNIAIVALQVSELFSMSGGVSIPGFSHAVHFRADLSLLMSLAFSLLALVAYISSSTLDEVGFCDHWSFIAGDILMYLGVANAVTGFFSPLNQTFVLAAEKIHMHDQQFLSLHLAITGLGAIAWFSAIYIGPLVTLIRSPFSKLSNSLLTLAYIKLLLLVFWLNHQTLIIETVETQQQPFFVKGYFYEIFQPLLW
ncbi:hypothetical protein [Vibrio breoganii]|uniref:hypothetical protein n=1 Tax=Vibrio breoganii TaxID=553239 RepID=UPI0002E629D6|nr:hypothetical protein [Vibrio breoganii]MDN3717687.1 hypothetical protein [Vibrio breoganii]OCH75473.1 hypothetical protein A6D95_11550 [Vibrio breoganii]OED83199.1 hypothetical protein A1QE_14725 [Vibrio breoganii ZF-55]OED94215.1 hypothetical protein A1QG_05570 [Vibrio breoganii ZF-29]OEF84297.1 hypothetical protein B003_18095 [Vibrio breoganii 1C10]